MLTHQKVAMLKFNSVNTNMCGALCFSEQLCLDNSENSNSDYEKVCVGHCVFVSNSCVDNSNNDNVEIQFVL